MSRFEFGQIGPRVERSREQYRFAVFRGEQCAGRVRRGAMCGHGLRYQTVVLGKSEFLIGPARFARWYRGQQRDRTVECPVRSSRRGAAIARALR